MIHQQGHHVPTKAQQRALRAAADDSFTAVVPQDFGPVPEVPGYLVDPRTVTALACVCVTPHDDTWVGADQEGDGDDGPADRRAIFWLVEAPRHHRIHLQVGLESVQMTVGDWVVFDDRILHSVISTRKWRACAYQVRPR